MYGFTIKIEYWKMGFHWSFLWSVGLQINKQISKLLTDRESNEGLVNWYISDRRGIIQTSWWTVFLVVRVNLHWHPIQTHLADQDKDFSDSEILSSKVCNTTLVSTRFTFDASVEQLVFLCLSNTYSKYNSLLHNVQHKNFVLYFFWSWDYL